MLQGKAHSGPKVKEDCEWILLPHVYAPLVQRARPALPDAGGVDTEPLWKQVANAQIERKKTIQARI